MSNAKVGLILAEEYRTGSSSPELAEKYGVSPGTILTWLRSSGEPIRSYSEAGLNAWATGRISAHGRPPPKKPIMEYWTARPEEHAAFMERVQRLGQAGRSRQARQSHVDLVCAVCKKEFTRPPSKIKYPRVVCSYRCAGKLPRQRAPHEDMPCGWCGVRFYRSPGHLKGAKDRPCCNRRCSNFLIAWRRFYIGEPRPLILEKLRLGENAQKIGAEQAEMLALRADRKRKSALTEEKIGPIGEALLRAERKDTHG